MNILDPVINFGRVPVSTGYNATATTVVLSAGEGERLPQPSTDGEFNLTWWDAKNYPNPSDDPKREIVRVTARSSDTLTVIRGQEGITATTKNTAGGEYYMMLTPTADTITKIDNTFLGWNKYTNVIPKRASADDPTYVLTFAGEDLTDKVSEGMKIKWTQDGTVRYGFVTAISYASSKTTLTLYGGTDYEVEDTTTHTISDVYFSHQKAPLDFPLNPDKWSKTWYSSSAQNIPDTNTTDVQQLGTAQLSIPIGIWDIKAQLAFYGHDSNSRDYMDLYIGVSTTNNSYSDIKHTNKIILRSKYGGYGLRFGHRVDFLFTKNNTSKQTIYVVANTVYTMSGTTIQLSAGESELKATIAYL